MHDFEHFRFRKQDSVIRNENKESIIIKNQPILFPHKRSSYLSLNLEAAEIKQEKANTSKLAAWFKKPSKSELTLLRWKDNLEDFLKKMVDFERSFL